MARTQESTVKVVEVDGQKRVEVQTDVRTVTQFDRAGVARMITRLDRTAENVRSNKARHTERCDQALADIADQKRRLQEAAAQLPVEEA